MIKIYVMNTCPDCEFVKQQAEGNANYEIIDIGQHARNLKAFLKLRDTSQALDRVRKAHTIGIPCFVLEDGTVTMKAEEAGLKSKPIEEGAACSLDGSGC